MGFSYSQTGIERSSTKLVFDSPPIILDRHAESSPTTTYELSITGAPVVTQMARDQDAAMLRLRIVVLSLAQVGTLKSLIDGGPVTVKLTPGTSTTITAVFADASEQRIEPLVGEHPERDATGAALDTALTRYRADLTLLRLE